MCGVVTLFNNCEGGGLISVRGRVKFGNNREECLGTRGALP